MSILLLAGCNRGAEPGAPEEMGADCVGEGCAIVAADADQTAIALRTERTYTNAKDIIVSWTDSPSLSEFQLDLAADEFCQSSKKTLNISGRSAHLLDLDEGVWFLCLKWKAGPRSLGKTPKGLLLVVDRQPPSIEGLLEQTLASGGHAEVKVSDATESSCSWKSQDLTLKILQPRVLLSEFEAAAGGSYEVLLECQDQAGNSSSQNFLLNFSQGEPAGALGPQNVMALTATAATQSINLNWADGGGGASSYLVLRSTSAITARPVNGMSYTQGSLLGGSTVAGITSSPSFKDSNLVGNVSYFYKVVASNAANIYASGVETNSTALALKVLKTTLSRTGIINFPAVEGLRTLGNYSYVCREYDGLAIVNSSNPAAPSQTSLLSLGNNANTGVGWCSDVKVLGNFAYVADWDKGLIIVDVTNPAAPLVKGSLPLSNASIVQVEGNFAYVALENGGTGGGLAIVDVTNPSAPSLVGAPISSGGNAAGVAKVGNFIYLTHRDSGNFKGLKIYDITNPAAPNLVKTLVRPTMEEIEVKDGFAYVTVGTSGLEIFDLVTPANPVSKSLTPMPDSGYIISVSIADNFAFVTNYGTSKINVLDITNKSAPTVARTYVENLNAGPLYIHVAGAYAYITNQNKGMQIIEVFEFQ